MKSYQTSESFQLGSYPGGKSQWFSAFGTTSMCALLLASSTTFASTGGTFSQKTIGTGHFNTVAVRSDGTVWEWGLLHFIPESPDSFNIDPKSPNQVPGLNEVIAVAGGGAVFGPSKQLVSPFTVALKSDGTVWTWGFNDYGQLGNGTSGESTKNFTPTPIDNFFGVTTVATGAGHVIAIKSDGTVWTWGANSNGQLGIGDTVDRSSPVQVHGLTGVIVVEAGLAHSVAIKSDGTVWAWGSNGAGQLGDGDFIDRLVPVQVQGLTNVISIDAGFAHTVAIRSDGTLWAWGLNVSGQLGDGTTEYRSIPVQITSLTDVIHIACGLMHSLAVTSDGSIWTWGNNLYGQLGHGESGSLEDSPIPSRVNGISGVLDVGAGDYNSIAQKSDGSVWVWGANSNGQVGDGSTSDRVVPVNVFENSLLPQQRPGIDGVAWVSTYTGATGGPVTVNIWGSGFDTSAKVSLQASGATITASVTSLPGGYLVAVFDLENASAGSYQLEVINSDGKTYAAPKPFTIESTETIQLWVDVVGRTKIARNREYIFWIRCGNSGNRDAEGVPVFIKGIPNDAEWKLGVPLTDPWNWPVDIPLVPSDIPNILMGESASMIPILISRLAPGVEEVIPITIKTESRDSISLSAEILEPLYNSPMRQPASDCVTGIVDKVIDIALDALLPTECLKFGASVITDSYRYMRDKADQNGEVTYFALTDVIAGWTLGAVSCGIEAGVTVVAPWAKTALAVGGAMKSAVGWGEVISSCGNAWDPLMERVLSIDVLSSHDPNAKVGPAGYGEEQFIMPDIPMNYTVLFENKSSATAPAQEVTIRDHLDLTTLDALTFELGEIGFGDTTIQVPPGQTAYTTEIDLPAKSIKLTVEGEFDPTTGMVTWKFTSLDPATNQLPLDPTLGFLPPNETQPEGEGYVTFNIKQIAGLATGTQIKNQARIIFDLNDPIDTDEILNTIDGDTPTSQIEELSARSYGAGINVVWSGEDGQDGSDIANYDIYVSDNGALYTKWLAGSTDTSAIFVGEYGHSYSFYSTARDNTGNLEDAPLSPDTTTLALKGEPPVIVQPPQSYTAIPGSSATLSVLTEGNQGESFEWKHGDAVVGGNSATLTLSDVQATHSGKYTVRVSGGGESISSRAVTLGVKAPPYETEKMMNISTRGQILEGFKVLIAGFVLEGSGQKYVLIRGIGPTLGDFGVIGFCTDPKLTLFRNTVPATPSIAENDVWGSLSVDLPGIFQRIGAFALTDGEKDAVIPMSLDPGAYTAKVSGLDGTGVGLVELYDADLIPLASTCNLANISTRGEVGTQAQILIAGFVIAGDVPKQVLVRGIGPRLADFDVSGTLVDPYLRIVKNVGSDQLWVASNDNWSDNPNAADIITASATVGAFDLVDGSKDAVMLTWLEPGTYTAQVSGVDDGTGVALVEVYEVK